MSADDQDTPGPPPSLSPIDPDDKDLPTISKPPNAPSTGSESLLRGTELPNNGAVVGNEQRNQRGDTESGSGPNVAQILTTFPSSETSDPISPEKMWAQFEPLLDSKDETPRDLNSLTKRLSDGLLTVVCCADKRVARAALSNIQKNDKHRRWLESHLYVHEQTEPMRMGSVHAPSNASAGHMATNGAATNSRRICIEDAVRAIPSGSYRVIVVVWAMSFETRDTLVALSDGWRRSQLLEFLRQKDASLVIVTNDANFNHPTRTKLMARRKAQRWLLATTKNAESIPPERPRRELRACVQSLFTDSRHLLDVLANRVLDEEHRGQLPLPGNFSDVCATCSEILHSQNYVHRKELYEELIKTRPKDKRAMRRIQKLQRMYEAHQAAKDALEDETTQYEEDEIAQYQPYRNITGGAGDHAIWVDLDPLTVMLQRVRPERWVDFEKQLGEGKWGPHHDHIVETVRRCIENDRLLREIEEHIRDPENVDLTWANDDGPIAQREQLEQLEPLSLPVQMALFVATFLPYLDPDEFESVIYRLLTLEQTYLDAIDPLWQQRELNAASLMPSAPANPMLTSPTTQPLAVPAAAPMMAPRSLVQEWAVEGDHVLQQCRLVVRGTPGHQGGATLEIGCDVVAHQSQWRDILSTRRHYFVTRQIDVLKRLDFLMIFVPSKDEMGMLFDKLVTLQCEQASRLPLRRHVGWPDVLARQLVEEDSAHEDTILRSDAPGRKLAVQRIALLLERIDLIEPDAASIARFVAPLIEHDRKGMHKRFAVDVLAAITSRHEEVLRLLCVMHDHGDVPTRNIVTQAIVERCDTDKQGVTDIISAWLMPAERPEGDLLAARVVARAILLSAARPKHALFHAMQQWLGERKDGEQNQSPEPVLLTWLRHSTLESLCSKGSLIAPEPLLASDAAILGPYLSPQPRVTRHARIDEELRARIGRESSQYPLLVGSIVTLWTQRLLSTGLEAQARRLITYILAQPRFDALALQLLAVATTLRSVVRADLVSEGQPPKHRAMREEMQRALDIMQSTTESHLRQKRGNHGQNH